MKKETMQAKLAALLGIEEEVAKIETKKKERNGVFEGVSEEEIQELREAQGIVYFLQAPALFSLKTCKHCGADFLVSRLYVAFCSYTCIYKSLEEQGFQWRKFKSIEAIDIDEIVKDVYEGNEPIWVRNLPQLQKALEKLTSLDQLQTSQV